MRGEGGGELGLGRWWVDVDLGGGAGGGGVGCVGAFVRPGCAAAVAVGAVRGLFGGGWVEAHLGLMMEGC